MADEATLVDNLEVALEMLELVLSLTLGVIQVVPLELVDVLAVVVSVVCEPIVGTTRIQEQALERR